MADANSTSSQNQSDNGQGPELGVLTSGNVLQRLWERVEHDLSPDELKWFSQASEYAEMMARQLRDTVDGIGCLVDAEQGAALKSGSFQHPSDLTSLLFGISNSIDTIRALNVISSSADYRLRGPRNG